MSNILKLEWNKKMYTFFAFGLRIVRVINTIQIFIINICFTKTTHFGMEKNTKFLKCFFSLGNPKIGVLTFEMMP